MFSLFEDNKSDIWIGSLDYGLFTVYITITDKIEWYNNENGFLFMNQSRLLLKDKKEDTPDMMLMLAEPTIYLLIVIKTMVYYPISLIIILFIEILKYYILAGLME